MTKIDIECSELIGEHIAFIQEQIVSQHCFSLCDNNQLRLLLQPRRNTHMNREVTKRKDKIADLINEINFIEAHPEVFEIAGIHHSSIKQDDMGRMEVKLVFFNNRQDLKI